MVSEPPGAVPRNPYAIGSRSETMTICMSLASSTIRSTVSSANRWDQERARGRARKICVIWFRRAKSNSAGNVGVRELVDHRHLRMPGQNGAGIHLLESRAAVFDDSPGNAFEPFGPGDRVLARVRLEVA